MGHNCWGLAARPDVPLIQEALEAGKQGLGR